MHHAVNVRQNVDERAERGNFDYRSLVNLAHLDLFGLTLDALHHRLGSGHIAREDPHRTVWLDGYFCTHRLEFAHVFTAWADNQTNFFGVNFCGDNARCVSGHVVTRRVQHFFHLA